MKLSSLIPEQLVFWDMDVRDHREIYQRVAQKISDLFSLSSETIRKAFIARDDLGFTALPGGYGIPHARIDDFGDLIIALVRTRSPIPYGDGMSDMFFLTVTDNTGTNLYLKSLATLARFVQKYGGELRNRPNAAKALQLIEQNAGVLNEPLKARDIMNTDLQVTHPDEPVETALDRMKKFNLVFLPVTDAQGHYLGKIDIADILKLAFPSYVMSFRDLSFLNSLKSFEDFTSHEKSAKVADIMNKDMEIVLDEDTTFVVLAFQYHKNRKSHFIVVNHKKNVVGVISGRDILHNILRA